MVPRRSQNGAVLPYFLLAHILFCFAVFGSNTYTSHQVQRMKEQELLYIGRRIRVAIERYHNEQGTYPASLDDLVRDRRFVDKHHLRRLYKDPFTGKADWRLIASTDGNIQGVASRSDRRPLKQTGFDRTERHFKDADAYRDWTFLYQPDPETQSR